MKILMESARQWHPDGYFLTVVDTLGKAMAGSDENAQQAASAFTLLQARLRAELGGSVLALHHSGHSDGKRARGSSLFGADPDVSLRIDRKNKDMTVALTMLKQKDAAEWTLPRYVKLAEILVSELTTLVAVRTDKVAKKVSDKKEVEDSFVIYVLDTVVAEILKANPMHSWKQQDLADAVAMDKRISLPSHKLARYTLRQVRELNGTVSNRCYDPTRAPKAGQWRWREEEL